MGVDWYTCNHCGDTFPDCGSYYTCDNCWTHWDDLKCAEADGAQWNEEEDTIVSCKFCRQEDATDSELVNYMLKHFKVTREEMVKEFYNAS